MQTTQLPEWLVREYPFAPHGFTTERGARLSYLDEGPRTDHAVVMVHGNPTWSYFYRDLVVALRTHRRCVALDHVGMGLSDKPQKYPYTLAQRIRDLGMLIEHLQLRRVDLVVHDWGGAIGCGWAGRNPGRVGRVVVLNTAAFRSQRIPRRIALCKTGFPGTALVRGFNGFAWPATWMAMSRRRLTPHEKAAFLFPYGDWSSRVAVDAFVKDIPLGPTHPTYGTLTEVEAGLERLKECPMQIVWGGRDFCFNDSFLKEWASRFPDAGVTRLGDVGHYVLHDGGEDALRPCVRHLLN